MHKKLSALYIVAILGIVSPSRATAESSKEYAMMGRTVWSAFECSSLASESNNPKEQDRLFKLGYRQGNKFIAALESGKMKKEDLNSSVPTVVLLLLQGPTPDFMLGRIFESAQTSALKDVYKNDAHNDSKELRALTAGNRFASSNCEIVGL